MKLRFLTIQEVMEIHRDQIGRYGGSLGVRDIGLLESAVAQPTATFGSEFLHRDLFEMAAAYLFHIAKNHPFVDGNKRTACVATLVFLYVNGVKVVMDESRVEELVLSVAEGKSDKATIAEFLRKHVKE
ncbi:MAG: type II toxin-antitoxin system death-on-curing family toxin [Candidatus Hydrogenedentes bacterium]|nr:type II toxin-antitoxin system death-on-curing family toxin [Candidatus Hydrogenedentota bacterium]